MKPQHFHTVVITSKDQGLTFSCNTMYVDLIIEIILL